MILSTVGLINKKLKNWDFIYTGLRERLYEENVIIKAENHYSIIFQDAEQQLSILDSAIDDYTILNFYDTKSHKFHFGLPQIVRDIILVNTNLQIFEIRLFEKQAYEFFYKRIEKRILTRTKIYNLIRGNGIGRSNQILEDKSKRIDLKKYVHSGDLFEVFIFQVAYKDNFFIEVEEFIFEVGIQLEYDLLDFIWGDFAPIFYTEFMNMIVEETKEYLSSIVQEEIRNIQVIDQTVGSRSFIIITDNYYYYLGEHLFLG